MKLTPQEIDTFKHLSNTEIGRFLVDYAKKLQDYAHDSRSWEAEDSKESAAQVSRFLQKYLIDKISNTTGNGIAIGGFE